MILTRERITLQPLEESLTNTPLELAGVRAGSGLYVAKGGANWSPPAAETPQLAQSVDTEGALAIATTIGVRDSPVIKFAAIEPDDPPAINYVTNPQCINANGFASNVGTGIFEAALIRDLVGFDYAIYQQCPGQNANEGVYTGVMTIPAVGGQWTGGVWLKGVQGGESIVLTLNYTNGLVASAASIFLTNDWQWYTVTGPLPLGVSQAWLTVSTNGVVQGAFYATGWAIVNAPSLSEYFDGTYPGCTWTGAPHASPSNRPSPGGPRLNAIMADIERLVTQVSRYRNGTIRRITPTFTGPPLRITYDLVHALLSWDDSEYMGAGIAQGTITFVAQPYGRGPELTVTFDNFALWKIDDYLVDASPVVNLAQFTPSAGKMTASSTGLGVETRIISDVSPYPLHSGEVSAQFTPGAVLATIANGCVNPSFEHDNLGATPAGWTNGFTGGGTPSVTTFTVQPAWAKYGSRSLRMTAANVPSGGAMWAQHTSQPAAPGQIWSALVSFNVQNAQTTCQLWVNYFNASGTYIGSFVADITGTSGAGIQTLAATSAPAPAGTAKVSAVPALVNVSGGTATVDSYIDAVMLAQQSTPITAYIDPDVNNAYVWGGTPGNAPTVVPWKGGVVLARSDAATYLEAYVSDNGAGSTLTLDKMLEGIRTTVLSGSCTRIAVGTSYVVRARAQRQNNVDLVYVEYFANTTDPIPASRSTPTTVLGPYTITDPQYSALVPGAGGLSIVPLAAGDAFTALRISPYLARERSLPVLRFGMCGIPGSAPALGRMIVQEDSGNSQKWCRWGQQGVQLSKLSALTDTFIEAETLTPVNGSIIGPVTGSSSANAMSSAALTATPAMMLNTRLAATGAEQAHAGFFGVYARVKTLTSFGVTVSMQWATGDFLRWIYNPSIVPSVHNQWVIVDLGVINVAAVIAGVQQWRGAILGSGTPGDTLIVDCLFLVPLDDGGAEIQGIGSGDYAIFASQQLEIRADRANRTDQNGTLWTPPSAYTGTYMRVPNPRYYDGVEQLVLKCSRGVPAARDTYDVAGADTAIDVLEAQVSLLPRYAQIPDA